MTQGNLFHTDNFDVKSNDDFAISNNGELEMFKRTNNGENPATFGREDPRNILGDVFVGRKPQNRSPKNYQDVVDRLTR